MRTAADLQIMVSVFLSLLCHTQTRPTVHYKVNNANTALAEARTTMPRHGPGIQDKEEEEEGWGRF
ncbi:AraC family transcriptional regulator [Sesbania bispinosa]|nr:AraC family transcriptional regulator [Sesbania bispinosa]